MPKEERVQPLHHCRQAIEQLEGGMRTVHKDMPGDGLFIPHKNEFADFGLLEARGIQVEEMLSREATLVSEIASMRAQLKLARQDAHAGRKKLDVPWLRRLNYAIIMRNKSVSRPSSGSWYGSVSAEGGAAQVDAADSAIRASAVRAPC
ncbi:hypothetical protein EGJ51_09280 [Pseudomonas fulva]|nr:hypothetical protein EGJ51_09280 [Pseudomonas fulva]